MLLWHSNKANASLLSPRAAPPWQKPRHTGHGIFGMNLIVHQSTFIVHYLFSWDREPSILFGSCTHLFWSRVVGDLIVAGYNYSAHVNRETSFVVGRDLLWARACVTVLLSCCAISRKSVMPWKTGPWFFIFHQRCSNYPISEFVRFDRRTCKQYYLGDLLVVVTVEEKAIGATAGCFIAKPSAKSRTKICQCWRKMAFGDASLSCVKFPLE